MELTERDRELRRNLSLDESLISIVNFYSEPTVERRRKRGERKNKKKNPMKKLKREQSQETAEKGE